MKKAAVIGQYGEGPAYVTGQAVKTYFLVNWLKKHYGPEEVVTVNTYGWKKHPVRLFLSVIRAMAGCRNVVILPAQHGVKVFAPLVAGLNRLFHRRLFYVVIGGWLADTLKENARLRKAVASFDNVCAETRSLARDLRAVGVKGAWHLPNCRNYAVVAAKEFSGSMPLRICTYSRVTESKGIADAAAICRKANGILGFPAFMLEVYGVVDPEYKEAFEDLCSRERDVMRYQGVKNADQVLETLSGQFALLFPTYYEGECFAGTVLDAFVSRTPIICNDWKYNSEVIRDGVNGILYPFRDVDIAAERLAELYRDPALYARIQKGCARSARKYDSDAVLAKLTERMDEEKIRARKKIGLIGVGGEGARFATGQAVKSRTLLRWFQEKYGPDQVYFGNIDSAKKHPFRVLKNMLTTLSQCGNIVFMPGQNIEVFAPVLRLLNLPFRRKVQYIVTGGDLAEVIKKHPSLLKPIAGFDGTHVQAVKLRDELRSMGISHAQYLPNCRDYVPAAKIDHWAGTPVRVCTYSRVTKEKGILDAIEICKKANALLGKKVFVLEVYGKMYDDFEPEFKAAMTENEGLVSYGGVKKPEETVQVLRDCFAILFPTYFECECFAGTALDAFSARIPIIANDWLYNSEAIRSGVDGFIYPFRDNDAAAAILAQLYTDRELYARIQQGCEESMQRFSTENVMGEFARYLS